MILNVRVELRVNANVFGLMDGQKIGSLYKAMLKAAMKNIFRWDTQFSDDKYSRTSLSRTHLFQITTYLEVNIESLF